MWMHWHRVILEGWLSIRTGMLCRNLLKEWHQIMVILTHLMSILFPLYINKPKNTCSSSQVCIIRLYYKYCNNFSAFTFNLYEGIVMACSCFNSLIFDIMSDVYWQIKKIFISCQAKSCIIYTHTAQFV